jgi:hypothetical protein
MAFIGKIPECPLRSASFYNRRSRIKSSILSSSTGRRKAALLFQAAQQQEDYRQ